MLLPNFPSKLNLFKNKKGDSSIIFKWFFGFIAGALILIFIVKFSNMHIGLEDKMESGKIVVYLDDKLDAFSIGEGSDTFEFVEDFSLGFGCDVVLPSGEPVGIIYSGDVYDMAHIKRKTDKVIFAPKKLEGNRIFAWTKRWKFPYDVVSFDYLTNENTMVVLVYDTFNSNAVGRLMENIPGGFNIQSVEGSLFNPNSYVGGSGWNLFRVIYFGNPSNMYNVNNLNDVFGDETEIEVIEVDLSEDTAKIKTLGGDLDTFYLGEEMLYGLIFSGSAYPCVKDVAIERLRFVTSIYTNKVSRLMDKTLSNECENLLYGAAQMLNTYADINTQSQFYYQKDRIEEQDELLISKECPAIYSVYTNY